MKTLFELPKPIEKDICCLTCKNSYKAKEFDSFTEKYRIFWYCSEHEQYIRHYESSCFRYIYDPEYNFNKDDF